MAAKLIKPVSINEVVLSDLASRFLLNIPKEDEDDPMKLCTHIELAYWFYLDLVRPEDTTLPGCSMKEFMAAMFHHCPFLVKDSVMVDLDSYVAQWKAHKYKKPVRGGIILNQDLTKCLLVQGYPASTTWGFPKGKLEEGENDIDAAVRELYEETGFDSRGIIREKWYLEAQVNGSEAKMYIIPGVPDDTYFEPKTRKEIRSIQWFRVDDLPRHKKDLTSKQALGKSANSFFMIIPFISQLRKWISSNSKVVKERKASKGKTISAHFQNPSQQQLQSHSKIPAQNFQSSSKFQPPPQTHSVGRVSPSAPPLNVITQNAHNYAAGHHYGMEHGYETSEHRKTGMGYGSMGEYSSQTELQSYPSHEENHSPRTPQPSMSAFSRDDAAPIPYPPQHPHTLHPNHTLPAPLHHITTGHYSPGHNAIYPSHLAYTNSPYTHQLHHQQQPQLTSHQQYYAQPSFGARQQDGTTQSTQQHYGRNSPQQLQGGDLNAVYSAGTAHVPQNMAMFSARPAGSVVNSHPHSAYPVRPGGRSPQAPHRPVVPPPRSPGKQPYYYSGNRYPMAAAPSVNTAALHQPTPPSSTYPYYHTHLAESQQQEPSHKIQGHPPRQGHPSQQGHPPQGYLPQGHSQPQTANSDVWSPHIHHHVATGSQQRKQSSGTHDKSFQPVPTQQIIQSQAHDGAGGERLASSMASLSLAHYDGGTNSMVDIGGYNVTLKPADSMVRFRFNKEAILKTSNIKT